MSNKLNPNQEMFCQLYTSSTEFFGNGTQAYIEAYEIDIKKPGAYAAARVSACRLLTKDNILKRIDKILEETILNNEFVDKQLAFLITQHADFSTKMRAISEYNKLKQRITEKQEINGNIEITINDAKSKS
jgi:phage terminase small subunit